MLHFARRADVDQVIPGQPPITLAGHDILHHGPGEQLGVAGLLDLGNGHAVANQTLKQHQGVAVLVVVEHRPVPGQAGDDLVCQFDIHDGNPAVPAQPRGARTNAQFRR